MIAAAEEPRRTREIYDRAAVGLHALTGKPCGAALGRTFAADRWRAELGAKGRVETAVYCEGKCWLEVEISEGIDPVLPDRGRTAFYAAPYDVGQPWRTELPRRLAELVAFRSLRDFGPAKLVPGAVPPAAKTDIAFADTNLQVDVPAPLVPATKQCVGTTGVTGILVETDASDTVTKCESYDRAFDGNRPVVPCVCKAIAGKSFGGTGPRRASVLVQGFDFALKTTAGLDLHVSSSTDQTRDATTGLFQVKVSHESIEWWDLPPGVALEACFTSMPEGRIAANVEVTFDGLGTATAVKLTPTDGTMTPPIEKCVRDAFLAVRASCPAVPTSTATGKVIASASKP